MPLTLTKTRLIEGVWEGVLAGAGKEKPDLVYRHSGETLEGLDLTWDDPHWHVRASVPPDRIADGVQTFVIADAATSEVLASFALLSGEALSEDIRAEIALLRDELDMLKRAFRRHCTETASR